MIMIVSHLCPHSVDWQHLHDRVQITRSAGPIRLRLLEHITDACFTAHSFSRIILQKKFSSPVLYCRYIFPNSLLSPTKKPTVKEPNRYPVRVSASPQVPRHQTEMAGKRDILFEYWWRHDVTIDWKMFANALFKPYFAYCEHGRRRLAWAVGGGLGWTPEHMIAHDILFFVDLFF